MDPGFWVRVVNTFSKQGVYNSFGSASIATGFIARMKTALSCYHVTRKLAQFLDKTWSPRTWLLAPDVIHMRSSDQCFGFASSCHACLYQNSCQPTFIKSLDQYSQHCHHHMKFAQHHNILVFSWCIWQRPLHLLCNAVQWWVPHNYWKLIWV